MWKFTVDCLLKVINNNGIEYEKTTQLKYRDEWRILVFDFLGSINQEINDRNSGAISIRFEMQFSSCSVLFATFETPTDKMCPDAPRAASNKLKRAVLVSRFLPVLQHIKPL